MKNADFLIEEFEKTALSLLASENARNIMPGMVVVRGMPLNNFRKSVVSGSMSFEEGPASKGFLQKVGRLQLSETSTYDGVTVTQHWHYERKNGSEKFVFTRTFEERAVQETAVLQRDAIRGLSSFEFNRESMHTIF